MRLLRYLAPLLLLAGAARAATKARGVSVGEAGETTLRHSVRAVSFTSSFKGRGARWYFFELGGRRLKAMCPGELEKECGAVLSTLSVNRRPGPAARGGGR